MGESKAIYTGYGAQYKCECELEFQKKELKRLARLVNKDKISTGDYEAAVTECERHIRYLQWALKGTDHLFLPI